MAVSVAHICDGGEGFRRMKAHAARRLDQRLDDHGGDLDRMARDRPFEFLQRGAAARQIEHDLRRHIVAEQPVHSVVGIADRHRAQRVAVIGAAKADEPVAPFRAGVSPVLDRHLERDLDRDRARIAEEDVVEIRAQQTRQPPREPYRRLVHHAAEHHVRHRAQLHLHRCDDMGVVVAVARRPPRRDAVDQLAAVGEQDPRPSRADRLQRRRQTLHRRVWEPEVPG